MSRSRIKATCSAIRIACAIDVASGRPVALSGMAAASLPVYAFGFDGAGEGVPPFDPSTA